MGETWFGDWSLDRRVGRTASQPASQSPDLPLCWLPLCACNRHFSLQAGSTPYLPTSTCIPADFVNYTIDRLRAQHRDEMGRTQREIKGGASAAKRPHDPTQADGDRRPATRRGEATASGWRWQPARPLTSPPLAPPPRFTALYRASASFRAMRSRTFSRPASSRPAPHLGHFTAAAQGRRSLQTLPVPPRPRAHSAVHLPMGAPLTLSRCAHATPRPTDNPEPGGTDMHRIHSTSTSGAHTRRCMVRGWPLWSTQVSTPTLPVPREERSVVAGARSPGFIRNP